MSTIVVTGIGVVSSLGVGKDAFWQGCRQARSGLRKIEAFATDEMRSNVAGLVKDFDPKRYMPSRTYRRMSRISKMTVAASIEALEDSGLSLHALDRERVAIIVGTAYGGSSHVEGFFASLLEDGPRGAQPFLFPETVPNAPASHVAMYHDITGPNSTFCQNAISGEAAMQYACHLLHQKVVDVVMVAGAEELSSILFHCYNAVGTLNPVVVNGDRQPIPFGGGGLVLGEGAGMLVMEREDFARARGATPYGKILTVDVTGGPAAMGHYETDGVQMRQCIERAIRQSGLTPEMITHISTSANFSGDLDRVECEMLAQVFNKAPHNLHVSPLKYLMGDFGGAGVTRAAAILLSFRYRAALPTLRAEALQQSGQAPLAWHFNAKIKPDNGLMLSASYGGGCSCIIMGA
jgi:3-oxoacyl-[acyl-carrier-protein] synthase II